jgi:hypothetical protein
MTTKTDNPQGQLLSFSDLTVSNIDTLVRIECPEMPKHGKPGILIIRPLSAKDVLELMESQEKNKDDERAQREHMFNLIAKSLVNEQGERIVPDEKRGELYNMPSSLYRRLVDAVTAASGANTKTVDGEGKG